MITLKYQQILSLNLWFSTISQRMWFTNNKHHISTESAGTECLQVTNHFHRFTGAVLLSMHSCSIHLVRNQLSQLHQLPDGSWLCRVGFGGVVDDEGTGWSNSIKLGRLVWTQALWCCGANDNSDINITYISTTISTFSFCLFSLLFRNYCRLSQFPKVKASVLPVQPTCPLF